MIFRALREVSVEGGGTRFNVSPYAQNLEETNIAMQLLLLEII